MSGLPHVSPTEAASHGRGRAVMAAVDLTARAAVARAALTRQHLAWRVAVSSKKLIAFKVY